MPEHSQIPAAAQQSERGRSAKGKRKMRLYQRRSRWPRTVIISTLALALTIFLSVSLLSLAGERVRDEQLTTLQNALRRAAVTCYALEGRYPATLDYLTDKYGVVIDRDKFAVFYNVFGQNIMPMIQVVPIGIDDGIPMGDPDVVPFEVMPFEVGGTEDAF